MRSTVATLSAALLALALTLPSPARAQPGAARPADQGATREADRATSAQGAATGEITGTPGGVRDRMTGPAGASGRTDARAGSLSLHHADRRFVARAHADGLMEIETGRLAQERASGNAVRDFARRMVEDHGKSNARLEALAKDKGVVLTAGAGPVNRRQVDGLSRRKGEDFDREYLRDQVRSHERAIQRYEGQASGGRDAELVRFAQEQLPVLREHARDARELLGGAKPR